MSRRSQAQRSDDDDEEFTISQGSQAASLSMAEEARLAGQVCNLLLVGEVKKIPVKSADIKKLVLKKYKSKFAPVMKTASTTMKDVYGYEIKPVANNSYILVNTLDGDTAKLENVSDSEAARRGLLTIILTAIFMSEDNMAQSTLERYLDVLDLHMQSTHPLLGNIGKLVNQEFVRQKYLSVTLDNSTDPPSTICHWGERACLEFSKKRILELACKVMGGDMKPELWTSQWKAVQKEEEEEGEAQVNLASAAS